MRRWRKARRRWKRLRHRLRRPPSTLTSHRSTRLIGVKGQANGGVYQFSVPRRDPVSEDCMPLTPAGPLGAAITINFQPTAQAIPAILLAT